MMYRWKKQRGDHQLFFLRRQQQERAPHRCRQGATAKMICANDKFIVDDLRSVLFILHLDLPRSAAFRRYTGQKTWKIQYTTLQKVLLLISCLYCYAATDHHVEPSKFAASYLECILHREWQRSAIYLVGIGGTGASEKDLRSKLLLTATGPDDSQLWVEDHGMDDQFDEKP